MSSRLSIFGPTKLLVALALALIASACACAPRPRTTLPSHDELVSDHMRGRYAEVLRWCPQIVSDAGADPAQSDWCLFGYPAAMWLDLDTEGALAFVHTVCADMTGAPRGDSSFRAFYVGEVGRWYALPLRLQHLDAALERALPNVIEKLSETCFLDPAQVEARLNTELPTRREAR